MIRLLPHWRLSDKLNFAMQVLVVTSLLMEKPLLKVLMTVFLEDSIEDSLIYLINQVPCCSPILVKDGLSKVVTQSS